MPELPESFVENNGDGGGEVQAADSWVEDRHANGALAVRFKQCSGQAMGLAAEDEEVVRRIAHVAVKKRALLGCKIERMVWMRLCELIKRAMDVHVDMLPVVKPGTAQSSIVQAKSERPHKMQLSSRCSAQPRYIPCILWNSRRHQNDV